MKNEKDEQLLVILDFDGTIVSGHTHNTIIRSKNPDAPEYINGPWAAVHDFPIIGSMDTWKNIFESLNQQGHYTAINSFNSYGHIIPEFLEKIGLDEDSIKKVHIIAKLPANPKKENKNPYIEESIAKFKDEGFSGNPANVILIDDSRKNIEAAKQAGYQVIHAKKDGAHLIELQKKLKELKEPKEKLPPKPKQLSESELRLKIETLKKQREELVKQKEELEKLTKDRLEEINIYSNSEKILFNDPKLDELDLAYKANYDQLSEVTSKLSKLQSQVHKDKPATVSKEVIEPSSPRAVDLSHAEQLEQEIKKFKTMQDEHLEMIFQLSQKKKLSSEEKLTLSSLKSDLPGITLAIQAKEEYLGKIEKPDALVVDHDIKSKPVKINSENQGAVSKQKPHIVKPEARLKKRSEQTKDSESTHQEKGLQAVLEAKSKKGELLKNSPAQPPEDTKPLPQTSIKLIDELKAKQALKALKGTSTFFESGNSSTSHDNTKTQEKTKTALKQFSR